MPSSRGALTRSAPRTERWLPHAVVATAFVVVLPALAVWSIVPRGEAALLALSVPFGMLLSVLAASVGTAIWKRTPGSRDLVFADLMLWGWLRRLRAERRLARAETLLGDGAEGLSVEALTNLSALLEARDSFTYGHSQRVTRHAERIAAAMGLADVDVAKVRSAAALHDVGKLHTPREILNKPGRLTDEEFEVIRRHPVDGATMAGSLEDPMITAMIRHHHERLDGTGYPDGLAGEAIPIGARIIAVADTFDAMTSNRAYRRAASHKRALDVLRDEAGRQLDADAVAGFLSYYRGRRTVAWSAFVTAAPQRLFAWLGGVTPGVSASAAGAAALAIGVGAPPAPVVTPAAAETRQASTRAKPPAPTPAREGAGPLATRGGAPLGSDRQSGRRQPRRSPGKGSQPRRKKRGAGRPAPKRQRATTQDDRATVKPQKVEPEKVKPQKVKPQTAEPQPAKPQKVKPQQVKPDKVVPPKVEAPKVKPQPVEPAQAEPPKVKPQKVEPPKAKSPQGAPPQ